MKTNEKAKAKRVRPKPASTLVTVKLTRAREFFGLTQDAAGMESRIGQRSVSSIEVGRSVYIPNSYLEYMSKLGVRLDWVFDNNIDVDGFTKLLGGVDIKEIQKNTTSGHCSKCADNEQKITELKKELADLKTEKEKQIDGLNAVHEKLTTSLNERIAELKERNGELKESNGELKSKIESLESGSNFPSAATGTEGLSRL